MRYRWVVALFAAVVSMAVTQPALANHGVGDLLNCTEHFDFQEDAQAHLLAHPGDPDRLDGDRNGLACEDLPSRGQALPPSPSPGSPQVAPPLNVAPSGLCHSSYVDACVPPAAGDVDCPDGTGDGPTYAPTTDFRVVGPDVFGLDRDSDGIACETSGSDTAGGAITAAGAAPSPPTGGAVVSQRALARTGQGSGRQLQLAVVCVLLGMTLVIAPGVLMAPKKRMD